MKIVYKILWKLQVVNKLSKDKVKTYVHFDNTFKVNEQKRQN